MADKKKQLVWNIIDFLKTSQQDGTVKEDDKESLDVAIQCLAEAFEVDPESTDDSRQYSVKPASLQSIFEVAIKTLNAKKSPIPDASAGVASEAGSSAEKIASAEDKKKAEALKMEGNAAISAKSYSLAIQKYSEAIALDSSNPVYYSNRAAAYSAEGSHEKAVEDAQESLKKDPKFVRGYSRLGHAQYSIGNFSAAVEAYTKGIQLDGNNANMKASLAQAQSKATEQEKQLEREADEVDDDAVTSAAGAGGAGAGGMPDLASLASMFGGAGAGAGGAGGAGGMPDLASMMQNPMMMQMAQQMMSNGGLERLMSNPSLRNMAERMQGGGGMPDLDTLRNDPEMRNLAEQFMGGRQ